MRSGARRRACTYVVAIGGGFGNDDLRSLARYLSTLGLAGCEVLILDDSAPPEFDERAKILRWVGRHVAAAPQDMVHAAAELAGCEKVIVASPEARYSAGEVRAICELLERHEVVEPQEYVEPLPWWGGIDAGRLLLHRGVDQVPQGRASFALRRRALRPLHGFDDASMLRFEAYEASVFVRRDPPRLTRWLAQRGRDASSDLAVPMRSAFFLAVLPLLVALAVAGGLQVAAGYAGVMAFASVVLAVRGRIGAGKFFPLRACLFAPLWLLERSVSIYWALFERLRMRRDATSPFAASPSRTRTSTDAASRS